MKKIIAAVLVLTCSFSAFADAPYVDEKVLTAFNKTFQHAQDVSWTEKETSYEVEFRQNDIASRVYYDRQGNILKSYRYYQEQQLPLMVLSKVRNRFAHEKICGVVEEATDEGILYFLTLETATHWLQAKADGYGAITVLQKFRKA